MSARQESPSNDTEAPVAEIPKLSKNAQKRLLRKQRHEATREEWKAKRREKKRLSRQRKSKLASSACKADVPHIQQPVSGEVIIDLAFDSLMNEKEIGSLASQICRCYSINKKTPHPFKISTMGLSGNLLSKLETSFPDYQKWDVEFSTEPLDPLISESRKLVYLSADSETVIEDIDPDAAYIIGGIVDRNRFKGVAQKRAESLGIPTAKLPLGDHVKLKSSHVLTVMHVFELLCKRRELGGWKEAIEAVIPARKIDTRNID